MKTNKLTIEDQFLTLDQAKELQDLGINFNNVNNYIAFDRTIVNKENVDFGVSKCQMMGVAAPRFIATLSVAEMIEMLPKCIEVKDVLYELYFKKSSFYINEIAYELGYREYLNESLSINEFTHTLLRDALFEMIKLLKQNKFI